MDNLKTDQYSSFNEDDFFQNGDTLIEATVTITLCEYRNLIRDQARSEMLIEKKDAKIKDLEKKLDALSKMMLAKNPELLNDIARAMGKFFGWDECGDEDSEEDGGDSECKE